jgi:hypothetical protein
MDLQQSVDVLDLAIKLVGLKKNIIIDSGIYGHLLDDFDGIDADEDIFIIKGSEEKPINLEDIKKVFKKMQMQFNTMEEKGIDGRTYCYSGIRYNFLDKRYNVSWDS